jgi:hypothetical protein
MEVCTATPRYIEAETIRQELLVEAEGHITLGDCGLQIKQPLPWHLCFKMAQQLQYAFRKMPIWYGDLLVYVDRQVRSGRFDDKSWEQLTGLSGYAPETIRGYMNACEAVPIEVRPHGVWLKISYMQAVMKLNPQQQRALLQSGAQEGWDREELRAAVKQVSKKEEEKAQPKIELNFESDGEDPEVDVPLEALPDEPFVTSDGRALLRTTVKRDFFPRLYREVEQAEHALNESRTLDALKHVQAMKTILEENDW